MMNCALMKFKNISYGYGQLIPIESKIDAPFEIKRIYYISKVQKDVERGFHSHRKLHQILICLNGSVKIRVKNPKAEEILELNDPSVGLYIGPMIWREMFGFTEGCVLLVLASEYFDENDYIRSYDLYLDEAAKIF